MSSGAYSVPPAIEQEQMRLKMIAMRLHRDTREGDLMFWPMQIQITTVITTEKVYVMTVEKDTAVMIEDDRALFPSDSLITRLRLLFD